MLKTALYSMIFWIAVIGLLAMGSPAGWAHENHDHGKGGPDFGEVAEVVRKYVVVDTKVKGGYFLVYDQKEKKPLALTYDKMHTGMRQTEDGDYFICLDFADDKGVIYDIDVFLKEHDNGQLKITGEVLVHKKGGKKYYDWKEVAGKVRRVEVDEK